MNTKLRTGLGRRIKRGLVMLAAAAGITVAASVATAAPAAAEGGYYVLYPAMPAEVCAHQGNFAAITLNPLDPYSLRCYDISFPVPSFSIAGSLDIQGYCDWKYPGSVATVHDNNIFGWKCKRQETPPS